MNKKSLARLVHLNPHLFPSNALFLAAFRFAKIAQNSTKIENKANAYFVKVLKVSLATLKRYFTKLIEIGFLKREFNYKNNGEQTINTITINKSFFDSQRGAQNEPQNSIFSKEKNTTDEPETSSSLSKEEKSSKLETIKKDESFIKNKLFDFKDKIILKVQGKKIDFFKNPKNQYLLRVDNKVAKKEKALEVYNFFGQINLSDKLKMAIDTLVNKTIIEINRDESRLVQY